MPARSRAPTRTAQVFRAADRGRRVLQCAVSGMGTGVDRSIPLAIVVAGLAIAGAVYFGLRAQAPVSAPAVAAPVVSAPPIASREQVRDQATEALAYQRRALLDRCFRPALAAAPGLTMALTFDLWFDADGRQLARGVVEQPGTSTAELTRCVTDHLAPLQVPPPGGPIQVDVSLRFP